MFYLEKCVIFIYTVSLQSVTESRQILGAIDRSIMLLLGTAFPLGCLMAQCERDWSACFLNIMLVGLSFILRFYF